MTANPVMELNEIFCALSHSRGPIGWYFFPFRITVLETQVRANFVMIFHDVT